MSLPALMELTADECRAALAAALGSDVRARDAAAAIAQLPIVSVHVAVAAGPASGNGAAVVTVAPGEQVDIVVDLVRSGPHGDGAAARSSRRSVCTLRKRRRAGARRP